MIDPLQRAVDILHKGGLVAFPTETVYGLGADATQEQAVKAIFKVKGRPENHPLIVHLYAASQLREWAREVPPEANLLAKTFWPGPLTLILKRAAGVLDAVTGGQDTVGVRVPDHPMALKLLKTFGRGVAAPSANRFGRVSPTSADHVRADLGSDVDFVLDGGPCPVGVESTIVDFTSGAPVILRPGGLTRERLEESLRKPVPIREAGSVRVSGQLESHYAPKARVVLVEPGQEGDRAAELRMSGRRVVVLSLAETEAQELYASLRRADKNGVEVIVVPLPAEVGLGLAVADRLRKAAGNRGA